MGEGQGPKQKKHAKSKSKKRKGKAKANVAENETSLEDKDRESAAFNNFDSRALMSDTSGSVIILDTGASSHMMPHRDILNNYRAFPEPHKIHAADKGIFEALGSGKLVLHTMAQGKKAEITLKDMLYAPSITFTLISIDCCDNAGY